MNIGDQRDTDLLADFTKGLGSLHARHRDPHDIGTNRFQPPNLFDGSGHITGFGVGHALYRNRRITTYQYRTHLDLPGDTTFDRRLMLHN